MLLSESAICGKKKSRVLKEQKAKGFLTNISIRWCFFLNAISLKCVK